MCSPSDLPSRCPSPPPTRLRSLARSLGDRCAGWCCACAGWRREKPRLEWLRPVCPRLPWASPIEGNAGEKKPAPAPRPPPSPGDCTPFPDERCSLHAREAWEPAGRSEGDGSQS
eukprot:672396-Rhodomonas_salina.1